MNKLCIYLSLFFITLKTETINSISFQELLNASEKFDKNICKFPTKANRICQIAQSDQDQENIVSQANSVQVIGHFKIKKLIKDFLEHKKNFGSEIEQKLYNNMTVLEFLQRLIKNRPLVFYTERDIYRLQQKNIKGEGCFENIGTECENEPLVLEKYLSYDEMQIAALLGVATPTFFINKGDRLNRAIPDATGNFEKEGIYVGLVGARFEKPGLMEWQHILITPEQNTEKNGYGLNKKDLTIWERFYGEKFPTFQEAKNDNSSKYLKLSQDNYFNISVYKKRLKSVIKPFLYEAEKRAVAANKKAHCRVVGLGLGVWKITNLQEDLMLEVYEEILSQENFKNISDIEFLYFNKNSFKKSKNSTISISFSKANPADKLLANDKLLVAMYAWDGNSYPGNEYWDKNLTGSGDPAAACCSTIAELQNPLINPIVLESCKDL